MTGLDTLSINDGWVATVYGPLTGPGNTTPGATYNSGTGVGNLHANIKDASAKINTLKTNIATSLAFITDLSSDFIGALNCLIFRREIQIF